MPEQKPPRARLKQVRILLWLLVALAVAGAAALALVRSGPVQPPPAAVSPQGNFGGPFTLVGADGKPFSSQALAGKPYAIYFGFTRCGDVCPTTLSRLVRLRRGPPTTMRCASSSSPSIPPTTDRRKSANMPNCSARRSSA